MPCRHVLGCCVQRYVELFRSTKGEMMTAVQQKMYGMYPAANSYSQYGAGGQVTLPRHVEGQVAG